MPETGARPEPPHRLPAFDGLTPDWVLDALDAAGFRGDGRILQLNSYENRVYQVMLEDGGAVVAKFYRPLRWSDAQILEEHAFAAELLAAEVPVVAPLALKANDARVQLAPVSAAVPSDPGPNVAVPDAVVPEAVVPEATVPDAPGPNPSAHFASAPADPTLATFPGPSGPMRYAVAPRCAGRAPELEDPAVLHRLGGFIGRMHAVGAQRPFQHRRAMSPAADARAALALLMADEQLPPGQERPWREACERAIEVIEAAFTRLRPDNIRLHGDCHPGNLLWRDSGAHVVDLDDACMGPAVQDLWMLLSGDPQAAALQLQALLRGYAPLMRFDRHELQLIEPLRLLRMIRHNAWVAQRWSDPAFPVAFPDFGSSSYWAQQVAQLHEQIDAQRDAPDWDALL